MDAWELIIVLVVVGCLMLASEMFMPGMVMGTLGLVALLVAVSLAFYDFGLITGTLVLVGVGLVTMTGFAIWMKAFPHTRIGRRLMLQKSLAGGEGEKDQTNIGLVGCVGQAITPLRPSGTALIDGRRVDVVAESELIESGADITVIQQQGMRVVVRKTSRVIPVVA